MNINEWPAVYEPMLGENAKNYVFISYAHEDTDVVYQDLKILTENGARVWYDRAMHVGQNWVERAKNRIFDKHCIAVLFYVSPQSLKSSAILKELEYAMQRREEDTGFSYMSINIGNRSAFNILKTIDVEEDAFLKFLSAFTQKKLYIPRSEDPFDQNHLVKLLDLFEEVKAIDLSKCQINTKQLFEFEAYEQGMQVSKYLGSDAIVSIPALVDGKKILAIGINAFRDNKKVKKITIPEGIEIIDDFVFSGCDNLETVLLPNSLLRLGYESFRECYSLQEIVIPYNVEKIGDYCFYKCHKLANIVLLSSVPLRIEFAAFSECHALENFTFPEVTRFIGPYAFNNCINLGNITIPKNVQQIGLSAFYGCASLSTVFLQVQNSIENKKWFARCRNLSKIVVSACCQQQYMYNDSWNENRDLLIFKLSTPQNLSFDSGILSWDAVDSADYYEICISGTKYESKHPFFVLPNNVISDATCYVIAHSYNSSVIDSEQSSEYVVRSDKKTFEIEEIDGENVLVQYNGNSPLVDIPSEVTVIAEEVFYNHEEIREVKLPKGLTRIEKGAFYHCLNLFKIDFPDSLLEIGDEAFWGAHIQELVLPDNMLRIGSLCFACCNYLVKLIIKSTQLVAGDKAFYRCIELKKVILPKGFPEIYKGMFRGCTELDEIILPEGIKTIKSGGISYVMRLQRLIIPKSVSTIEAEAFSNSFGLVDIFVDEANESFYDMNGVLINKTDNSIIHYPADKKNPEYIVDKKITRIMNFAFMDTEHLTKVVVEGNLSEIGKGAFERCPDLREVMIKGDVTLIQSNAFKDCINLNKLFLLSEVVPEIEEDIFANVSADFKIYVPERYMKNYLRIIEWEKYQYLLRPVKEEAE